MTSSKKVVLRPDVTVQPLVHNWYAWPHLVAPHTGALHLSKRLMPILDSYVQAPDVHDSAITTPSMYSGPFVDQQGTGREDVARFAKQIKEDSATWTGYADAITQARRLLATSATGASLIPLYQQLPECLHGLVELVYDTDHRADLRFYERMWYHSPAYSTTAQSVRLSSLPHTHSPFAFNSPLFAGPQSLHLSVPFAAEATQRLFATRWDAQPLDELAADLGVTGDQIGKFEQLFVPADAVTSRHTPPAPGEVRVRYFGHATVLVEANGVSVLVDPLLGYEPAAYDLVRSAIGPVDALFIGLEHVGAPLTWIYGPLFGTAPSREADRTRRLRGSDATEAWAFAESLGAQNVYLYAFGFEPWMKYIMGMGMDDAEPQLAERDKLLALCAERGKHAKFLYLKHEFTL